MDVFSRITPVYKSANAMQSLAAHAKPVTPCGLSGLIGSLFGCATPAYRTADGRGAKAPAQSSSFWSMFAVRPSYKTAPTVTVDEADARDPDLDEGPCAPGPDEIVVL